MFHVAQMIASTNTPITLPGAGSVDPNTYLNAFLNLFKSFGSYFKSFFG